ncbi:FCD domain-containing protein [Pelagibacterium montanilacus]|uniref:FCD domain-containing protein n=1 Tax=Pelagibacterium montanilacus TaxID=2185280 RepID=UPI0013DF0B62|nr:FCD domain-containing protein [Pelagibacterium montanilacus]
MSTLFTAPARDDESKTLSVEVYTRLRSDLIAGRLNPGRRLPMRQLSAHYGVGVAPLREALSRLTSERLVSFEENRGYIVAPVSLDDLNDLCRLRTDLSCKALRLSIEKGDEYWESEVLAAVHRLERAQLPASLDDQETIDDWERRHSHFHRSLLAACGSPWLMHFCDMLSDQFQRYRRVIIVEISASQSLVAMVREQHRTVAEATIERDADRASEILARHFQGSVEIVRENMGAFGQFESGKRRRG